MKPIIQHFLKELETAPLDERLSHLLDISDYMEHPYPHEDGYVEVVQQLVVLYSKESEQEARKLFVRNIERAYMYPISLEKIDFEPLISKLETAADPFFIRSVLYLLSMTYNRKYIPEIEKYLGHPDEEVRKEAQYILDTW